MGKWRQLQPDLQSGARASILQACEKLYHEQSVAEMSKHLLTDEKQLVVNKSLQLDELNAQLSVREASVAQQREFLAQDTRI